MAKDIYNILASKGRNGDTELAHITKEESNLLKMLGGSGTTNPWTGLSEYHEGGWLDLIGHPQHHDWWWTGEGPPKSSQQIAHEKGAPEAEGGGGLDWAKSRGDRGHGNYRQDMTSAIWDSMETPDKIDYIAMVEFGGVIPSDQFDSIDKFIADQEYRLTQYDPSKGKLDPTKVRFLEEEYGGGTGFGPGDDGIYGTDDDRGGYAGRAAGITYGAAGRTYKGAGLTYETAGLAKETMFEGLQESAYKVGAPTTGRDLRGKIAGTAKIKKGFETGMDVYDIASRRYDIADETYEAAKDTYELASDRGGAAYREGRYGLTTSIEEDWQKKWLGFMNLGG